MILWVAGKHFISDELVGVDPEFVSHHVQKVFPPQGGKQFIAFPCQFAPEKQLDFPAFSVCCHFETQPVFLFPEMVIPRQVDSVALLSDDKGAASEAFILVFQAAFL